MIRYAWLIPLFPLVGVLINGYGVVPRETDGPTF